MLYHASFNMHLEWVCVWVCWRTRTYTCMRSMNSLRCIHYECHKRIRLTIYFVTNFHCWTCNLILRKLCARVSLAAAISPFYEVPQNWKVQHMFCIFCIRAHAHTHTSHSAVYTLINRYPALSIVVSSASGNVTLRATIRRHIRTKSVTFVNGKMCAVANHFIYCINKLRTLPKTFHIVYDNGNHHRSAMQSQIKWHAIGQSTSVRPQLTLNDATMFTLTMLHRLPFLSRCFLCIKIQLCAMPHKHNSPSVPSHGRCGDRISHGVTAIN